MSPCACRVVLSREDLPDQGLFDVTHLREILYCKLHGAAPEMLTALKNMVKRFEDYAHERPHPWCGCTYCNTKSFIERVETEK